MVTRHLEQPAGQSQAVARDGAGISLLARLLEPANVRIAGSRPWDIRIHDPRTVDQVLRRGTLGAGEAYMRGWWDAEALDEAIYRILRSGIERQLRSRAHLALLLRAWLSNPQRISRAFAIGEAHYDLGDDLFQAMLDERMVYSCGYWQGAASLETAQENKLDLICRKLGLTPGQRLLDIGCGWGSLCRFAAEHYGVHAVGITVSEKQQALARELCRGLPVEIRLQDYRDLDDRFEHVASVGMFEHVGEKNYRRLFETVRRCLAPGGLFLLHTIGGNRSTRSTDPWIERYIFPRSHLPSLRQVATAAEGLFVTEDLHNFGSDYDRTLMAWFARFDAAWPDLRARYGETFYRMWKYYLLSCAAAFRARHIQLWQFVFSPAGVEGGYARPPDCARERGAEAPGNR